MPFLSNLFSSSNVGEQVERLQRERNFLELTNQRITFSGTDDVRKTVLAHHPSMYSQIEICKNTVTDKEMAYLRDTFTNVEKFNITLTGSLPMRSYPLHYKEVILTYPESIILNRRFLSNVKSQSLTIKDSNTTASVLREFVQHWMADGVPSTIKALHVNQYHKDADILEDIPGFRWEETKNYQTMRHESGINCQRAYFITQLRNSKKTGAIVLENKWFRFLVWDLAKPITATDDCNNRRKNGK